MDKSFDKVHHSFMMKTVNIVGMYGKYLRIIKAVYDKPTASSILGDENLKVFSLRSQIRQECPLLSNIVLSVVWK